MICYSLFENDEEDDDDDDDDDDGGLLERSFIRLCILFRVHHFHLMLL